MYGGGYDFVAKNNCAVEIHSGRPSLFSVLNCSSAGLTCVFERIIGNWISVEDGRWNDLISQRVSGRLRLMVRADILFHRVIDECYTISLNIIVPN